MINNQWVNSFFEYDGHGSVRALTDINGSVTDSYDFDAFGNLINKTGNTPNNYLYAGEQWDPDLGLYYNRARYLNVGTGRFWSRDSFEGTKQDPLSLHKYSYTGNNPINRIDPSGNVSLVETTIANAIGLVLDTLYQSLTYPIGDLYTALAESRAERISALVYFASGIGVFGTAWYHAINQTGVIGEEKSIKHYQAEGEHIIDAKHGGNKGFDFYSVIGTGGAAEGIINEVKNYASVPGVETYTALGLGRSGTDTFDYNKEILKDRIRNDSVLDGATKTKLINDLDNNEFRIRLIYGTHTPDDLEIVPLIKESTRVKRLEQIERVKLPFK